ncbi:MAG: hypothetical protein JWM27_378 [Gemmatimonadetes bacterium]|nr:hypothetical protein [Gemmatimonadota bacterium]
MIERTILWTRLDRAGHESARLVSGADGNRLQGTAVFEDGGRPCRLHYDIACDVRWRTLAATVEGWLGRDSVHLAIAADPATGRWTLDGRPCPQVDGHTDLDLSFSPVTNLLPIRRLGLSVGRQAYVAAAWLRVPSLTLEPLPQTYTRTGEETYRYESAGGAFVRDLTVDAAGLVTLYPGLWQAGAVE